MVYRDDVEALAARYQALEAELAERTRARDEAGRMLAEARARARHDAMLADFAAGGPARRRRQRTMVAALVTIVAMAIGGATYRLARTDAGVERSLRRLSQFTDQMCACSDRTCAMAVSDAMVRWAQAQVARDPKPPELDQAMIRRASALARTLGRCIEQAMIVGR